MSDQFRFLKIASVIIFIGLAYLFYQFSTNINALSQLQSDLKLYTHEIKGFLISPTPTMMQRSQTIRPSLPPQEIVITIVPKQNRTDDEWGVAKQIGEHTYTIRVGSDDRMGTREEILSALNNYREVNGAGALAFDDRLNNYAQGRADTFASIKSTDAHAGFNDYLENHNGFEELHFARLGENSYYGGPLYGVHLIEWVFAKSPGHNANQIDRGWTHVGIGVTNSSANLIFAEGQI